MRVCVFQELVSFIQRQDSQKQQKVILDKKGGIAKQLLEAPKKVSTLASPYMHLTITTFWHGFFLCGIP